MGYGLEVRDAANRVVVTNGQNAVRLHSVNTFYTPNTLTTEFSKSVTGIQNNGRFMILSSLPGRYVIGNGSITFYTPYHKPSSKSSKDKLMFGTNAKFTVVVYELIL